MRLERDQRGCRSSLPRRIDRATDDVEVAEVDAVEAADGQRNGADRLARQSNVNLGFAAQLSTFSGTNVRRSGSVWPSATRRPPAS
jgi:hypothetical protein